MAAPFGSGLRVHALRQAQAAQSQLAEALAAQGEGRPVEPVAGARGPAAPFGSALRGDKAAWLGAQPLGEGSGPVKVQLLKNALNGGEISPELGARFDVPRYSQGCELLLNMIPLPTGGVTRRPGFKYVGNAGLEGAQNIRGRLCPWVYTASVSFMLLFMVEGDSAAMVYWTDRNGLARPKESGCQLPYRGDDIFQVCCCQVGKIIYMAHPKYPPGKLIVEAAVPPGGGMHPTFTYERINFHNPVPYCYIDAITTDGGENTQPPVSHYYKVCAVDKDTGREGLSAGAGGATYSPPTATGLHWVIKVKPVANAGEYRVYRKRGGEFGFIGRITQGLEFEDYNYAPDVGDQPPTEQEFFEGEGNYPAVVFLHQQRLGWAATDNDPLTVWLSQTSNFECLDYKSPPNDDDGIEVTLASSRANRILWAMSDRSGLAIGTEGEEWYLTGADGTGPLTPGSLSFQPQTAYGTVNGLGPVRANSSLLFVQRGGRIIRDLGYSFAADRYEAQDLTLLARHLLRFSPVTSWCWQSAPHCILWLVLASGKLIGLTYMPEQEVCAWHRHETEGEFLSCASMQDSDGTSRLWVITRRRLVQADGTVETHHCVEMLAPLFEGKPEQWDGQATNPAPLQRDGVGKAKYRARCIPCLPEAGAQGDSSALRVKKINGVKFRVLHAQPFRVRVLAQGLPPGPMLAVPHGASPASGESGRGYVDRADWYCPLGAGFREGSKLEIVADQDSPLTLLALNVICEVAGEGGDQG